MKHTHGPWSVDGGRQLYGRHKPRYCGSFITKNIGSVKRLLSQKETDANLVLLMSSPELLVTLIEMMPIAELGLEATMATMPAEDVKRMHKKMRTAWALLERFK